jgi:hypothetical protein
LVLMFSCFAEDLGKAIYKPIESTALFAVNQASSRARSSERSLRSSLAEQKSN